MEPKTTGQWNRRDLIKGGSALAAGAAFGAGLLRQGSAQAAGEIMLDPALPTGIHAAAKLDALPGKVPLLKLSYRPPNYETPLTYFKSLYTPNDAFFVRYHLADIPEIDAASWRLKIDGEAAGTPMELTLDQLKRDFEAVEIAAVCQCSGNRRGLFQPHVPGVEWGYGAMGNAKWKGARLRDVLNKAGIKKEAVEIVLDGADGAVIEKTPDFVKSLPVWKALDENVLIAYEMNDQPLPHFNGFPARIVVPGWTATYWMKHIAHIRLATQPFDGFWMKSAYRIPNGKFPIVQRFLSQETAANTPISEMVVNSLITSHFEGERLMPNKPVEISGIAWDAGYGIRSVEVSTDGGKSWTQARLGADAGRFSFRPWSLPFAPPKRGSYALMARATNTIGQSQAADLILNPAGYHHNLPHRVTVAAI